MVQAGELSVEVRPHFLEWTLHALNKSWLGIRRIAVGLTLRRLKRKVACAKIVEKFGPILAPRQLIDEVNLMPMQSTTQPIVFSRRCIGL